MAHSSFLNRLSLSHRPARLAGFLLLAALLSLYLFTLDNGLSTGELVGGDLITHQYAQVQARPSNAPGYPLYTMGGWLWFHLGRVLLGDTVNPIRILSSFSTLWAVLALALLYRLLLTITDGDWPLAFLCTAFYGATYFFWYYAVTTEQYTSAVLHTLAIVWCAFQWERTRADRYLAALVLLLGLALAHMVTVLLIALPLIWFLLPARSRLWQKPRRLWQMTGLALLPLASYAYVYVRGAQHPEWRGVGEWASTWDWFWRFLSTQQGQDELAWSLGGFTPEFPSLIWRELTLPVLLLGLVGIAFLGRRRAIFIYGTLALYFAFAYVDRFGNWFQVIMPAYPLVIMGLAALAHQVGMRFPHRWVRLLVLGLLIIIIVERLLTNYPLADSSNRPGDDGLAAGWSILQDEPAEGAAIFATRDEALALDYVTQIWGVRPDVHMVNRDQALRTFEQPAEHLYVTHDAAPLVSSEISSQAHLSAAGQILIRVRPEPLLQHPSLEHTSLQDLGDGLRLLGFQVQTSGLQLSPAGMESDRILHLSLYWQAVAPPQHDYVISVRVMAGELLLQQDHPPVWGFYPTTRWLPGEVVRDDYALSLPAGAIPVEAKIVVYRPLSDGGFDNLAEFTLTW